MVWGKEHLLYARMGISGRRLMETIVEVLKTTKILWDPTLPLLGTYTTDYISYPRGLCTSIFITVLLTGAKIKSTYMSINRWLDNENVVHRQNEFYWGVSKNEIDQVFKYFSCNETCSFKSPQWHFYRGVFSSHSEMSRAGAGFSWALVKTSWQKAAQ